MRRSIGCKGFWLDWRGKRFFFLVAEVDGWVIASSDFNTREDIRSVSSWSEWS